MAKAATKVSTKKTAAKAPSRKAAAPKAASKASTKVTAKKAAATKVAKAPAKAVKKAATSEKSVAVMTLRHIAEKLSELHELPKRQANEILAHVVELITKSLKKGEKIRLSGLGILQVRKRAARMGRNPQTGEPVKIKASKKIAFRPAKDLKEAI